jgi:hypothetical protein
MLRNQFLVNLDLHHLVDRSRLKQIVRLEEVIAVFSVYVPFEILVSLFSYV